MLWKTDCYFFRSQAFGRITILTFNAKEHCHRIVTTGCFQSELGPGWPLHRDKPQGGYTEDPRMLGCTVDSNQLSCLLRGELSATASLGFLMKDPAHPSPLP